MTLKSHPTNITVKDKILLHLLDYPFEKFMDPEELDKKEILSTMPKEVTQEGIAEYVGINWNHVSRVVKEFEKNEWVMRKKAHVIGGGRRRNIYFLTPEGSEVSQNRKVEIDDMTITIVREGKKHSGTVTVLKEKYASDLPLPMMLREIKNIEEDLSNLDEIYLELKEWERVEKEREFIEYSEGIPAIRHFYGRSSEVAEIMEFIESDTKFTVVQGIAGIGKSLLAARLIQDLKAKYNTFYYNLHEWDTIRAVLEQIADFLSQIGKNRLKTYLTAKRRQGGSWYEDTKLMINLNEIYDIIESDFSESNAVLIFDDLQKSEEHIGALFSVFLETLEKVEGIRIVVFTRNIPNFYSTRDISIKGLVKEYRLTGLDLESSKKLLEDKKILIENFDKVYETTGGHPLALELMMSPYDIIRPSDIRRFMHKEVFVKLSKEEIRLLSTVSVFRMPVPAEAFIEEELDYTIIENLVNNVLLEEIPLVGYKVHDLVKEISFSSLPKDHKKELHFKAAKFYEEQKEDESLIEAIFHYLESGSFHEATEIAVENGRVFINRGFLEELRDTYTVSEDDIPPELKADVFMLQGDIAFAIGEWDESIEMFQKALGISDNEMSKKTSNIYRKLGHLFRERSEWDIALDYYNRSLEISNSIDIKEGIGDTYRGIGKVHWRKGEDEEALGNYQKSLDFARINDDLILLGETTIDIGMMYIERSPKDVETYYKQSLEYFEKAKAIYGKANVLNIIGVFYYTQGDFEKALDSWNRCIELSMECGNIHKMAYALFNTADIYASKGDFKKALSNLDKSLSVLEKMNDPLGISYVYQGYGILHTLKEEYSIADKWFQKSIELTTQLNIPINLAERFYEYAQMFKAMKDTTSALSYLTKALDIYEKHNKPEIVNNIKSEIKEIKNK